MGAVFVDSLDGASGESQGDSFLQFGHINALFLEIRIFTNKPSRIKLGGARAVRIPATYSRTLFGHHANLRHSCAILAPWSLYFK